MEERVRTAHYDPEASCLRAEAGRSAGCTGHDGDDEQSSSSSHTHEWGKGDKDG